MIDITKWLVIKIKDDGIGLDKAIPSEFGNGLVSMRNRMKELGGSFEIESKNGTEVTIKVRLSLV
jgi:signal transduction histidine kinase